MAKSIVEQVIERMIGDGLITEEELKQRIQEEREKSPFIPLQEDNAFLIYDSMEKDFRITELEQMNAELTYSMMMGGM